MSSSKEKVSYEVSGRCINNKLTSNCIIESLLSELASLVRRVENLVVEHREVESKSQTDGVRRCQVSLGNLGRALVGFEGLVGGILTPVTDRKLSQVAVVVSLPVVTKPLERTPHELIEREQLTNILW